jgi:hypothetical protein
MAESAAVMQSLAEALHELAQAIASQKAAPPYVIVASIVGALSGLSAIGWHLYQLRTRCPDFEFREFRVSWFSVGGPGIPVDAIGTWVGPQGSITNGGHRAGSVVACELEAPTVSPADGQGCFPASFAFPQFFAEGQGLPFDAAFHLSKQQTDTSDDLPCTLLIERDRGRAQRYDLLAHRTNPSNPRFFQERLRGRRSLW